MALDTEKQRVANCACGQLSVTCTGTPVLVSACHCEACQRRTGSAFGVAVFFDKDAVAMSGEVSRFQRRSDNGSLVSFYFCPQCGSSVYWVTSRKPDKIAVAGGAFGANDWLAPSQSVYEGHKMPWLELRTSPDHQP